MHRILRGALVMALVLAPAATAPANEWKPPKVVATTSTAGNAAAAVVYGDIAAITGLLDRATVTTRVP